VHLILQTVIILVLWAWLTGGLHYDGLADTADAWVGGFGDRERTLAIMKDPSCGPIGVLSILIALLLKAAAIYVVLEQYYYAIALLILPCLARTAPLILLGTCAYVRQQGIAQHMVQHLPKTALWLVVGISGLSVLSFAWAGLLLLISFTVTLLYLRAKFVQRLGGTTGDSIGASIEILETMMILVLALFLSYSF
jgi:adenosylcobinamide-GDP ribazoletransferase